MLQKQEGEIPIRVAILQTFFEAKPLLGMGGIGQANFRSFVIPTQARNKQRLLRSLGTKSGNLRDSNSPSFQMFEMPRTSA